MAVAGFPLAVVAGNFGWGSAGKLRLIMQELPDIPTVGLNGEPGAGFLELQFRMQVPAEEVVLKQLARHYGIRVALAVGEPGMANALTAAGISVVFVDSLPFMWTASDVVAETAAVYCAQQTPAVPRAAWPVLRRIRRLEWVESIVPAPQPSCGGGGVVVNVGGLHSPFTDASPDAYVRCVLPPVLRAIAACNLRVAAVCGNLDARQRERIRAQVSHDTLVGPVAPETFESLLRRADLLITAPGSTTLLAAHFSQIPVALLPPQNLSQVMNARWFMGDDEAVQHAAISWPAGTIDADHLELVREQGESAAVAYIYRSIEDAATSVETAQSLYRRALAAVAAPLSPSARPHLAGLGHGGAAQVAAAVRRRVAEATS